MIHFLPVEFTFIENSILYVTELVNSSWAKSEIISSLLIVFVIKCLNCKKLHIFFSPKINCLIWRQISGAHLLSPTKHSLQIWKVTLICFKCILHYFDIILLNWKHKVIIKILNCFTKEKMDLPVVKHVI